MPKCPVCLVAEFARRMKQGAYVSAPLSLMWLPVRVRFFFFFSQLSGYIRRICGPAMLGWMPNFKVRERRLPNAVRKIYTYLSPAFTTAKVESVKLTCAFPAGQLLLNCTMHTPFCQGSPVACQIPPRMNPTSVYT